MIKYIFSRFSFKKKKLCNLVTEQKEKKKEIFLKIQGWEAEHLGLNSESILIWHQNLEMSAKNENQPNAIHLSERLFEKQYNSIK